MAGRRSPEGRFVRAIQLLRAGHTTAESAAQSGIRQDALRAYLDRHGMIVEDSPRQRQSLADRPKVEWARRSTVLDMRERGLTSSRLARRWT
jgi:hypothetical protein